jgi:hypothetical protein
MSLVLRRFLLSTTSLAFLSPAFAADHSANIAGLPFKVDSEYSWSWANAAVKAGSAYQRGWTGQGRTVAVFDTGLYAAHPEFAGRLKTGYDAITGQIGVPATDPGWHGTFVAGIIAAARDGVGMQGIAYDARLLPVRIANANGTITLSDAALARGINYAAPHVSVFNNSWNSSSTIDTVSKSAFSSYYANSLAGWRTAVSKNVIIVWAAGNASMSQPGIYGELPAWYPDLQKAWVVAVATDPSGHIASYSNHCGSAAAWCIAAPGSSVISTYAKGGYAMSSGTSFAAPVVSGGAALMKQKWPYLSNQQIIAILFRTANKSGIYADSATYGQGLLDMDAATRPVGTVSVATGATVAQKTNVTTSAAVTSAAFGGTMGRSAHSVMVLDEYNREYLAPLSGFVAPLVAPYNLDRGLMELGSGLTTFETPMGARLAMAADSAAPDRLPRIALTMPTGGTSLSLTHGVSSSHLFGGIEAEIDGAAMLAKGDALSSAFRNLAGSQATGTAWETTLGGGMTLTVASLVGSRDDRPSDWMAVSPYAERKTSDSMVNVVSARVTAPVGPVRLGIESGVVLEHNTVLGSASEGAMSLGRGANTTYLGLSGETDIGWGLSLFGGFEIGRTAVQSADNSMVSGLSDLTSTAFHVGASKTDIVTDGDRLAVAFSQPLRVRSGTALLDLPESRDMAGNVFYTHTSESVAADGRELDLQLGYATKLSEGESLTISGMVRFQPDNIQGADPENIVMIGYKHAF